jgi:hypothetical protein
LGATREKFLAVGVREAKGLGCSLVYFASGSAVWSSCQETKYRIDELVVRGDGHDMPSLW